MNRDGHEVWTEGLSDYLDGGLEPEERAEVEAHLAGCAPCREVLADLRDLVARARALEPGLPANDLWPGIAGAIGAPVPRPTGAQVIPLARGSARPRRGLFCTVPQLAAASVVLVALSVSATWWAGAGPVPADPGAAPAGVVSPVVPAADTPGGPPAELAEELAALEQVLAEARARLDPNTVRILEKNLGVIERAIDESVRALEVDPGNAFLEEHLERAWREKAEFLREAALITGWEG